MGSSLPPERLGAVIEVAVAGLVLRVTMEDPVFLMEEITVAA